MKNTATGTIVTILVLILFCEISGASSRETVKERLKRAQQQEELKKNPSNVESQGEPSRAHSKSVKEKLKQVQQKEAVASKQVEEIKQQKECSEKEKLIFEGIFQQYQQEARPIQEESNRLAAELYSETKNLSDSESGKKIPQELIEHRKKLEDLGNNLTKKYQERYKQADEKYMECLKAAGMEQK